MTPLEQTLETRLLAMQDVLNTPVPADIVERLTTPEKTEQLLGLIHQALLEIEHTRQTRKGHRVARAS